MKLRILFFILLCPFAGFAQNVFIIPQPVSLTPGKGSIKLKRGTKVSANNRLLNDEVRYLKAELLNSTKIKLIVAKSSSNNIKLVLTKTADTEGSYALSVTRH